ncbi:MAG: DUF1697 domain-containing protein [Bacteroidota bacterium]
MPKYVAFLRGINVSAQKLIKMQDLREHFAMPGLRNISTYIQSGNVLFESNEERADMLVTKIEKQLAKKLGYTVPVIVRSKEELEAILLREPFGEITDGRGLYVTMLSGEPAGDMQQVLDAYTNEAEEARIVHREVYLLAKSYGNTKLNNNLIEKKLKLSATTRNWATMNKLVALLT